MRRRSPSSAKPSRSGAAWPTPTTPWPSRPYQIRQLPSRPCPIGTLTDDSHDGERQPDLRADLFAGYAYRAPDQRGDATSPMILRPPPRRKHPLLDQASMTSDGSSMVSVTVSRATRATLCHYLRAAAASRLGLEVTRCRRPPRTGQSSAVIEERPVEPWARSSPCRGRPPSK